jgi:hypothetical protein
MKRVRIIALLFLVSCVVALPVAAQEIPSDGKWVPLFNGKNLDGWTAKVKGYDAGDNFGETFRVENGVLKVSYDKYGGTFDNRFGHLFYKTRFSNYIVRVEYRFVGEQVKGGPEWAFKNSGIMIHGQTPQSMRKDQDFPVSIEVQLLGGKPEGTRTTANVCSPGTHIVMNGTLITKHCNDSTSPTFRGEEWVTAAVEVHGNGVIKHFVNGQLVLQYEQPQLDDSDADAKGLIAEAGGNRMLSGGTISLQSESHPIEFRKVEIMELR